MKYGQIFTFSQIDFIWFDFIFRQGIDGGGEGCVRSGHHWYSVDYAQNYDYDIQHKWKIASYDRLMYIAFVIELQSNRITKSIISSN